MLFQGHTENFEDSFEGTNVGVSSIGIAFYQGLWSYDVAIVSGSMIGAGIFMSPQYVLAYVGSPGASMLIWVFSGVVALFGALSYIELGTIIPESGGEFTYILRIYGSFPAFFAAITFILLLKPSSIAAKAMTIARYVMAPFYPGCPPPQLAVKCFAAFSILVAAMTNILNVRLALRVQVIFLVAKVFSLTFIVIGGLVKVLQGSTVIEENFDVENAFQGTQFSLNTLGKALLQGLWSYGGWSNLNYVTEELNRPEVNLPRAVLIAISLVTTLYLLVNVSYLTVMTPKELMSSSAVAVTWGNKVLGSWGWVMSVAAALSAFGSLNGTFFSGGRVCFVAAREGHMVTPDILSMAHVHRLTPSPALIFTTIISLVVLTLFLLHFDFVCFLTHIVPIVIPILVLAAAIFLVLAPIIDNPQIEYLYVALFILSGVIVYIPFIHYKLCPGMLDKLTVFLQLFLEVAPADKNL
uniref:B(0,+)-type amino acid transporter 1 n=1 Tax=Oreochromis niloticus TaxID=8128 RepID=A0A669D3K3_ORENI